MDSEMVRIKQRDRQEKKEDSTGSVDIYDMAKILDKREVDVWHWDDPLIKRMRRRRGKGAGTGFTGRSTM